MAPMRSFQSWESKLCEEPSRSKITTKRCSSGSASSWAFDGWPGTPANSSGTISLSSVAARPSVTVLETTKKGRPSASLIQ